MSSLEDTKRLSTLKLDIEKDVQSVSDDSQDDFHYKLPFMRKLLSWGVEARGMLSLSSMHPRLSVNRRNLACPARAAYRYPVP